MNLFRAFSFIEARMVAPPDETYDNPGPEPPFNSDVSEVNNICWLTNFKMVAQFHLY